MSIVSDPKTAFVLTLAGGAAVATISTWLAYRRATQEKVWEKKVKAYESILDALHTCRSVFSQDFDLEVKIHNRSFNKPGSHEETPEEKKAQDKRRTEYQHSEAELRRIVDTGGLILPSHIIATLRDTLNYKAPDYAHFNYLDYCAFEEQRLSVAIKEFSASAKKDLQQSGISRLVQCLLSPFKLSKKEKEKD